VSGPNGTFPLPKALKNDEFEILSKTFEFNGLKGPPPPPPPPP